MKYRVLVILLTGLIASCQTKEEVFTKEQIKAKADSITAIKIKEISEQAAEDLNMRLSIEVKPKTDSIVNATLNE